jgi:hypothetical protein
MKQHTGLEMHDGYAPHDHRIYHDHEGVPGIMDDTRRLPPEASDGCAHLPPAPEDHAAAASWILQEIDTRMRDEKAPRSLLELAVIALAHAVTALAAREFTAEGGSAQQDGEFLAEGGSGPARGEALPDGSLRARILSAMRNGGDGLTAQDLALSLLVPSPVITGELGQLDRAGLVTAGYGTESGKWFLTGTPAAPPRAAKPATLREQILFWLPRETGPYGWTLRALADQTGRPENEVLAELARMKNENLVRTTERGQKITWSLLR